MIFAIQRALSHLLVKQQDNDTVNEVFSRFCIDDSEPNEDCFATVQFQEGRDEINGMLFIFDENGTETRHGFRISVTPTEPYGTAVK